MFTREELYLIAEALSAVAYERVDEQLEALSDKASALAEKTPRRRQKR